MHVVIFYFNLSYAFYLVLLQMPNIIHFENVNLKMLFLYHQHYRTVTKCLNASVSLLINFNIRNYYINFVLSSKCLSLLLPMWNIDNHGKKLSLQKT